MIGFAAVAALCVMPASPSYVLTVTAPSLFELRLDGHVVLKGRVTGLAGPLTSDQVVVSESDEPAVPMFLGYPHGPKTADWVPEGRTKRRLSLKVSGIYSGIDVTVLTGKEAFACTTDPSVPLMTSIGRSGSNLDNAVYDRTSDRLVSARGARVLPDSKNGFSIRVPSGVDLSLDEEYYRNHLGYFLWDKARPLWPKPVAGWCSWAAYGQGITEGEVKQAAEFFGANLKEFGYDVIQIDDGYQRVLQLTDKHQPITEPFSDYWTKANDRFPHGMAAMAKTIADQGMTPGIWVGLYLPLGLKHADAYVNGSDGQPLKGPWVGYSMDSGNPAAVAEAYTDTLNAFRKEGWTYFKIDTLRHVLYDSYRRVPTYWEARHTTSSDAFRHLFAQVREAVGKNNYLLACWGALPELAGFPDGCRIGEDVGPDEASLLRTAKYIAQFQHANDVIWRNDPDYMCFRLPEAQCQTWATLTALSGGHIMVSDPIETYNAAKTEILRKVGPPMLSRPGNVAPHGPEFEWMVFNAEKEKTSWTVAARMGWRGVPARDVPVAELGLDPDKKYLAFDFWESKFLGVVSGVVPCRELGQAECQVVSLRPLTSVPQVLGDDRHIGQGVEELRNLNWDGRKLKGQFKQTAGHAWNLYLYAPNGWKPTGDLRQIQPDVYVLPISSGSGWAEWHADFVKA